uniref:Uncharacterized protein n=1 Tax=Strongyloides stercoralis TaxID=6248 RepID=A0A0K0ED83_STRER
MKIYLVQLTYLYIISLINFVESSTESVVKVGLKRNCSCLVINENLIQTANGYNNKLSTNITNSNLTSDGNNQKTTKGIFSTTQEKISKLEETTSIKTSLKNNETSKSTEIVPVPVIKDKITTQKNIDKTTSKQITNKIILEIESTTIFNNVTTDKNNKDLSKIMENKVTVINKNKTLIEKKQTTRVGNTLLKKNNETNKIVKESKLITKAPSTRFSIYESTTKATVPLTEYEGIVFKIFIFIKNFKKTINNFIFY